MPWTPCAGGVPARPVGICLLSTEPRAPSWPVARGQMGSEGLVTSPPAHPPASWPFLSSPQLVLSSGPLSDGGGHPASLKDPGGSTVTLLSCCLGSVNVHQVMLSPSGPRGFPVRFFFFLIFISFVYLLGCVGPYLWHAGSSVAACGI